VSAPEGGAIVTSALGGSPIAVSPDGRLLLAVVTGPDGRRFVWIRSLDALAWHRLAETEGAVAPFWSPDGRAVAFSRHDKLQQVTLSGEDVRTIYDGPTFGGTWNHDDVILFARPTGLYRVSASGGAPVAVLEGRNMLWPVFLPDGRHFICLEVEGERTGIHLMSLDSRDDTLLKVVALNDVGVVGFTAPNYLVFVEHRALMAQAIDVAAKAVVGEPIRVAESVDLHPPSSAFGVSMTGTLAYAETGFTLGDLTWARSDGTPIGKAAARVATARFAISPDGSRVAVGRDDTTPYSVWINDLAAKSETPMTAKSFACCPVWSPDGTRIALASARNSPPNLYLTRPGSGAPDEQLLSSPLATYPLDWTSDGEFLVYGVDDPKTRLDLWVLPLVGDPKPRPLANTAFNEWDARVSPNGRWIAYVSDEPGHEEVYVARFPGGDDRRPVSVAGGRGPAWSSDSRQLYYRDQESIVAVSIAPGERFAASPAKRLFSARSLRSDPDVRSYDVAPDGRFLLNVFVERKSLPMTVVTDWRVGVVK
jgi:Periplasmic component of the Tol biopolymer transport system